MTDKEWVQRAARDLKQSCTQPEPPRSESQEKRQAWADEIRKRQRLQILAKSRQKMYKQSNKSRNKPPEYMEEENPMEVRGKDIRSCA